MRQDCIKITAVILVPYNRQEFGATATAEKAAQEIHNYVTTNEYVAVDKWQAKHTSYKTG